jgi:hypothetical protein
MPPFVLRSVHRLRRIVLPGLRMMTSLNSDAMKRTSMTTATTLESKEIVSLSASDKVEGTAVYGTDDKKIGKLERVMIDKISGKVAYAVLSFGGFLGMGEDYYPMPWSTLKYNTSLGGYPSESRVVVHKDDWKWGPSEKYSWREHEGRGYWKGDSWTD